MFQTQESVAVAFDEGDGQHTVQRNDVKHIFRVAKMCSGFLIQGGELLPVLEGKHDAWCPDLVDPYVGLETNFDVVPHRDGLGPRLVDVVRHCEYFHLDFSTANELQSAAQLLITATRLTRHLAGF